MVRDIQPNDPYSNYSSSGGSGPLSPAALNALGNELWLSLNLFYGNDPSGANATTYQLSMKAINDFMNDYTAQGSTMSKDPYLRQLFDDLNTSNPDQPSLASLAADFTKNGYTAAGLAAFQSFSPSIYAIFSNDLQRWGSVESSYQSNPQGLTLRDLSCLAEDLNGFSNPPTQRQLKEFLQDVGNVQADLQASTPPLDGCCQMLQNFLNVPLDPSNPHSTLADLSASGDVTDLQTYLKADPSILTSFATLVSEIQGLEKFSS